MANKPLRLYFGGSKYPSEYTFVDAVFAHTSRDARRLLWKEGRKVQHDCDGRYFDLLVSRQREHDGLAASLGITEPQLITDSGLKRDLHWYCEGDAYCASCEKSTWGDEFPICEHCERCDACGHTPNCQSKESESD